MRGADDNGLSVDEMVRQLKGGESGATGEVRTRGLRPGAAAKGASVAGQSAQAAPSGSLSMRVQFDFGSDRLSPASHAVFALDEIDARVGGRAGLGFEERLGR